MNSHRTLSRHLCPSDPDLRVPFEFPPTSSGPLSSQGRALKVPLTFPAALRWLSEQLNTEVGRRHSESAQEAPAGGGRAAEDTGDHGGSVVRGDAQARLQELTC